MAYKTVMEYLHTARAKDITTQLLHVLDLLGTLCTGQRGREEGLTAGSGSRSKATCFNSLGCQGSICLGVCDAVVHLLWCSDASVVMLKCFSSGTVTQLNMALALVTWQR